jgi:DNA-binding MarR family transcriptional regulator
MSYTVDADIALFAVKHKLEKELRAYLCLRDFAKDRSGYFNRKQGATLLSEAFKYSRSTPHRHIKTLLEMGWVSKAGKGNLHINGILRVKALLQKHVEGFQIRKRVYKLSPIRQKFQAENRNYLLNAFKANLCSGLTQDKIKRNEIRVIKGLHPQERKNKAVLGTALAKAPHVRSYSFSLKSQDWKMSPATALKRKQYAEEERLEWYRWEALGGMTFKSERNAVHFGNAHLHSFNRGYLKKRGPVYLVCIGESVNKGSNAVGLKYRRQKFTGDKLLSLKISGVEQVLKAEKIKPIRSSQSKKNLLLDDFRPFAKLNNDFSLVSL